MFELAFWRGNGVNVLKIMPESAVKFAVNDLISKRICADPTHHMEAHERFLAGALAGVAAQSFVYPLEIAKTRLAVSPEGAYKGLIDCLTSTVRQEGFRALYRGFGTSALGIVPYAGTDLMVFNTLKSRWVGSHPSHTEGPDVLTLLGMAAQQL